MTEKSKEQLEKEEAVARETWDSWVGDLETKEQPSCNIDNPDDCEACGS
jgi:hypothetical protein